MTNRCEDYPCCGHTDGLGCNWTYTPEAQAFDQKHAMCDHEAGVCDAYYDDAEPHEYDHDDLNELGVPWCYGCDYYASCGEYEPDGAPVHQWEVTTPPEVYMNEDSWLDGSYEE